MYSHDVVVSVHGAQMTSVPFMPPCGVVLELLPKFYFLPGLYGKLARDAGLLASQGYLSETDPLLENNRTLRDFHFRWWIRRKGLCLPVRQIGEVAREVLSAREQCLLDLWAKRGGAPSV